VGLAAICGGCKEDHSHGPAAKGHGAHDHHGAAGHGTAEHGAARASELVVSTDPREPRAGQTTKLDLMIHEPDGGMVRDFETVHEAKVHLIIVREGLDRFAHIHPEVDDSGNLKGTFAFPAGGTYRLFADYKPAKKAGAVATAVVKVGGESQPAPPLVPDVPGKVKGDGLDAEISVASPKAGTATVVTFRLFDPAGQPVRDLQPYLGAMGHLVVLSAEGKEYVHAHPVEKAATDGTVAFEAHFSRPGIFKGWGQFKRAGNVHTVPHVLKID
jgi:hypothetical protein